MSKYMRLIEFQLGENTLDYDFKQSDILSDAFNLYFFAIFPRFSLINKVNLKI